MSKTGIERRRTRRRPVLDTFSLFVVAPTKGMHRLRIYDLSEEGIGFDLDTEGEDHGDFPLRTGDTLTIQFYLNQSLYLPLAVKVMRLEEKDGLRRVGAELTEKGSQGYRAFQAFVAMLDQIVEAAQITSS